MQFVKDDQPVIIDTITGEYLTAVDNDDIKITLTDDDIYGLHRVQCVAFFKKLFIRIEITYLPDYFCMCYFIYVPRSFCRNAVGHLGNCDDNSTNDALGLENGKA